MSNLTPNFTSNKVGQYAVTASKAKPWLTAPIVHTQSKTRKAKSSAIIVNPIFEECANLTSDSYWILIFNQAAIGKYPKGFTYKEGVITHKRGTKIQRLEIPTSVVDVLPACITFLGKTAGLISPKDAERNREEYDHRISNVKSIYDCTWVDIKNQELKKLLFIDYTNYLSKIHNLTDEEKRQLATMIHIGTHLGFLNDKNIDFADGKINDIDGLIFNDENRIFSIDPNLKPKIAKSSKRSKESMAVSKNSFAGQFAKYFDQYEKKYAASGQFHIIKNHNFNIESDQITTSVPCSIVSSD